MQPWWEPCKNIKKIFVTPNFEQYCVSLSLSAAESQNQTTHNWTPVYPADGSEVYLVNVLGSADRKDLTKKAAWLSVTSPQGGAGVRSFMTTSSEPALV